MPRGGAAPARGRGPAGRVARAAGRGLPCHALGVARGQGAKFWELRAATSLARLWRGRGQPPEGHDLLAPVYGWFTEGFDTA